GTGRRRGAEGGVAESVVEPVAAPAERPAAAGQAEGERKAAGEREREEARQWHPDDSGRDRDERAEPGDREAGGDRKASEALEPAFGPVELRRRDVQPAAAALQQRPAAVATEGPASSGPDEVAEDAGER